MAFQFPRFSRSLRAHTKLDRSVVLTTEPSLVGQSANANPTKKETLWKELKLFSQQIGHEPSIRQLQRLWQYCHTLIGINTIYKIFAIDN